MSSVDLAAAQPHPDSRKFGTFAGVFRPVFLTVLGAMLYLREGWLVGELGLGGALAVIVASLAITGLTALSVASIATNVRVRAGGAFAIISASLGLEAGGAIGVPLYIAQTLSSVMYLYAFSEAWLYLFPSHNPQLVAALAFVGVGAVVLRSASVAARAQAVLFVVVLIALASAFLGWIPATYQRPVWFAEGRTVSLLEGFSLFFPAATGIMVGVGMSGDLENPRQSLPRGTLLAWGTTALIYLLGAVWYATVVPVEELRTDRLAMASHALFGPLVLAGLLSSTLMASLSSLVAAPRLLLAMAQFRVVPFSGWLSKVDARDEPRNGTIFTIGVAALGLLAGSLDALAPVITGSFVLTYLVVNLVVLLEDTLSMVSWRPTFAVSGWVPLTGVVVCLLAISVTMPFGGLPGLALVAALYVWLARRREVETPWETVQSGIVQSIAEWAARIALGLKRSERSWKPELLVPVRSVIELATMEPTARLLVEHRGSVRFAIVTEDAELIKATEAAVARLRAEGLLASAHMLPEEQPGQGARLSLNALQETVGAPNLVLLSDEHGDEAVLQQICDHARRYGVGVVLVLDDVEHFMVSPLAVNVWLSDRSPDWVLGLHVANLDLPVLLAYLLTRERSGRVRLVSVLSNGAWRAAAQRFLEDIADLGRLPDTTCHVVTGGFADALRGFQSADVNLLGLPQQLDLQRLRELQRATGAPCLFVHDSGNESALA